jgi:hypothetical protein
MVNPRIVKGRGGNALAVRGRVQDQVFMIGIEDMAGHPRFKIEQRLLEEARSLIRQARQDPFDWAAHRFQRNAEFEVWERTLDAAELRSMMAR